MMMKPGIRIAFAIVVVVIVLIATWLAVGTEDSGGPMAEAVQSASMREPEAAGEEFPSAMTSAVAAPLPREAEPPPYEQSLDDILIDEATGVEPSADIAPDPMIVPEGLAPEPMLEPNEASGF